MEEVAAPKVGRLEQMALDAIAKEKQRKAALLAKSKLAAVPVTALSPIQDLMLSPEERDWEHMQDKLAGLVSVYTWIMEDEALLTRVQRLEAAAKTAARSRQPEAWQAAKTQYLKVLGELCEVYYLKEATWEVQITTSFRLDMRRVYLAITQKALDEHIGELPADAVCFLVRELPFLIVSTPEQIQGAVIAKLAIPGATVAGV